LRYSQGWIAFKAYSQSCRKSLQLLPLASRRRGATRITPTTIAKGNAMPRLNPIDPAHADARAKPMLDAVHKKLGLTPNMMKTMAASPAVLKGYLDFAGALGRARPGKLPETTP
jgi:hypothetical protein